MSNRRFEMYQYRNVIHRMRMGESDRTIALTKLMGRGKCKQVRQIAEQNGWLGKEPLRQWSVDLPPTEDYQERTEEIAPPADLKPGFYFLIASHEPGFGLQNNLVSFTDFWVSDLALVVRTHHGEAKLEGFVLNAISGEPLAGAQVQAWYRARNDVRQAGPTAKTDSNGLFTLPAAANQVGLLSRQGKTVERAALAALPERRAGPFHVREK